ncbi:malto-oligosyltrehalose synthase [Antrihabitans sp. YC2-6]|uniref:malto-oligosyltrehalose synthase n=1 Tax=Antrihabitans sp. YC2-6 TaxID=2799498 RepID=UPI0018F50CC2|nr:malto-oligosyltrehalose synthase [Antrihabitans sp. YC2-6]MBJ8343176.1 malto-oligosyltrehalose synthase [Antrihabitans sp. YC2-6]
MSKTPIGSTYRLQLRGDAFTLSDARRLVDYLNRLGVTHLYLSPVLTASRGSTHGYDVTDPTTVSTELGGTQELQALSDELRARGMGLVIDIVPNHVGVGDPTQNAWWWDVLKFGRQSAFADFFDIDWRTENGVCGRIALPVLDGENDAAALSVDRSGPEPTLAFGDLRFPIAPGTDKGNPLAIHDRQAYRLVNWRARMCTYRRFFAVDSLAAIRQEDPRVFDATHQHISAWVEHDLIDGIRVDHPDGLADPAGYLARLRQVLGPQRWLVIEKILADGEPLDPTLPIDGTTGYDALADLGGVFLDRDGAAELTRLSTLLTGAAGDAAWLHDAERMLKNDVAQGDLSGDIARLVAAVTRETGSDCDVEALTRAVTEVIAATPVYRSDYAVLSGTIGRVVGDVEKRDPDLAGPLAVLVSALALRGESARRLQQLTGAVTAKGVEDCLFYRTARLVSLQEVGGNPGRFGYSPNEFHLSNAERVRRWPRSMTTLSTHDTKRGEDVRSRISVLSQVPKRWSSSVVQWEELAPSPDRATGLFLWQNMFGIWPVDEPDAGKIRDRLHAYAEKAIREAGVHTSWAAVEPDFEDAVHAWIDTVVDGAVGESIADLVSELAPHGWAISLGQKLLQLCGPGIPDIYQGTELWEDTLVDPDNRRLVDFDIRREMLASLSQAHEVDETGVAKMWVVAHSLWLRRERPDCFVGGTYTPIYAAGTAADRIIGFARGREGGASEVIALAIRHTAAVAENGWGDTVLTLPDGVWTDRLANTTYSGQVAPDQLFAHLPVALLVR